MKIALGFATVLSLTLSIVSVSPVMAQSSGEAGASTSARDVMIVVVENPRLELARRIMAVKGADLEKNVRINLIEGFDAAIGDQASEETTWIRKTTEEILIAHLATFVETIQNLIATNFTQEELTVMVELYESPLGASIARKEVESTGQQLAALRQLQVGFMTELATKYCARFDCKTPSGKSMGGARRNER